MLRLQRLCGRFCHCGDQQVPGVAVDQAEGKAGGNGGDGDKYDGQGDGEGICKWTR